MNIAWGLLGCAVIMAIAFLMSENKRSISLKTVTVGFLAQILFGIIALTWSTGNRALLSVSQGVDDTINLGRAGLEFVFGPLADTNAIGFIFAINVLGMIIFLTVLIALLYHFGIMQLLVRFIGGAISKVMGTSYVESVAAAANIFVGNTQAPLVVKPYLASMTRSQLFSVMVGGLASVSGAVLVGLSAMGIPIQYLLAAALMSAPAGLMIAKFIVPETADIERVSWQSINANAENDKDESLFDVIFDNAKEGLHYAINVGLMLITLLGLIALVNGILAWAGSLVGIEALSLELVFGYLFTPFALLIGIPFEEAVSAGNLLAQKIFLNEFVAFATFSLDLESYSEKSIAILTFALSGFANLGATGSIVAMLSGMVPERKREIQGLAIKALLGATLANLLNGAIVMVIL